MSLTRSSVSQERHSFYSVAANINWSPKPQLSHQTWSTEIQYFFCTDLEPGVRKLCPRLHSWYEINVQAHFCIYDLIRLSWHPWHRAFPPGLVAMMTTHHSAFLVNLRLESINVPEQRGNLTQTIGWNKRGLHQNDWQRGGQLQGWREDKSICARVDMKAGKWIRIDSYVYSVWVYEGKGCSRSL